ncbi:choice-of-anchor A family protein [Streptomyces globisporus]|uniref:choice-of-anchor A family protein n=1 Tax=Streptomyces globisporus TaxID=1908 RepID=UPI0004CBA0C0|nr:choice-of-anchor A family protein [Streptomyces globisporus]
MRTTAAVAAVLAVTGAALTWAPAASATTECASQPLGTAGLYAEFVEKDSVRHSDSEGAVAVGGDATFGDPGRSGFSVGSRLSAADLAKLPGGHSLVVGGTLYANQVVLDKGTGIAGKVVDRSTPGQGFGVDGDEVARGETPIDFGKEFAHLRTLSAGWAATQPNGTVSAAGDGLFLTGTDKRLNVFAVNAADLEKVRAITLDVPVGSSTLVNVLGTSYDMSASATYGVYYKNLDGGTPVVDDYAVPGDAYRQIRSRLLWNFPQAESVKKNHTSWPGTILAPNAEVEMGGKGVGPGHVNGSVIAGSLTTVPGAETHRMNFTGCLPQVTVPGPVVTPGKPEPTDTPAPTPPAAPAPTPSQGGATPGVPGTPSASAPPSTPATPGEATTAPAPAPSATPEGDLATTGSAIGPGAIGAAVAAVAVGGGFLAFAKRRRRAS